MVYGEVVVAVAQSAVCHLAVLRQRGPLAQEEYQPPNEGAEHKAIEGPLGQIGEHRSSFPHNRHGRLSYQSVRSPKLDDGPVRRERDQGSNKPMADEISYFEVASFLAEIESVEISDPNERTQWLAARLREK